ncbi:MAG: GTPase Era [Bacilli bacterium]|nr:GTPase Era [Bacilli bacterium]
MRSGFVTIMGRPNVGKSTLLNSILERKLAITSNKAQTTRNIIEGIYNDDDSQIIFIDTPGIHKPINKLGNILNSKSYNSKENVDLILFLVDIEKGIGKGDMFILEKLKNQDVPVILIMNKVDRIKKETLLPAINKCKELMDFKEIIPISALKNDNVETLLKTIKKYLTNEERIFDVDKVTNISTNFYASEIIREKVLRLTEEEVPHSVTCLIETLKEQKDKVIIQALIIVDRESLKKIIIGHQGSMLKEIGTKAREDLEEYFGKKVYLELFVKTVKNWREKETLIRELGLDDINF